MLTAPNAPAGALQAGDLVDLFDRKGDLAYEGEGISQILHGWQCARLAQLAQASPALQLAAWLHDVGHLLHDLEGTPTLVGVDDRHETSGAAVLAPLFGPDVAQPVALHVAAKRWLVTTRPSYRDRLSADSQRSLALQGGPMDVAEIEAFEALPHAQDAIRLRMWDEAGKSSRWRPASRSAALDELMALLRAVT